MTAAVPAVAVVVANRGGRCLAESLARLGWAAERAVLDPSGVVPASALPPGVRHLPRTLELESAGSMPSVVLVNEDEVISDALVDTLARTLDGGFLGTVAVAQVVRGFGVELTLPGRRVRVAPRAGSRLQLDRALGLGVTSTTRPVQSAVPVVHAVPPMDDVVQALDADSSMLAVILEASAARPRIAAVVLAALTASGRVLTARAHGRVGLARWVLAVLTAYRALLAYAKLWERGRARAGGTL